MDHYSSLWIAVQKSVKVSVLVIIFLIPRRKSGARHIWTSISVTKLSFNLFVIQFPIWKVEKIMTATPGVSYTYITF